MVKLDNDWNKVGEVRKTIYDTIEELVGDAEKQGLKIYRLSDDTPEDPANYIYQDKKCKKLAVDVDIGINHINGSIPYQMWVHDEKYYDWAYSLAETLEKKLNVEFELIKSYK